MIKAGEAFTRPQTPAAKCLHLVRLNPIITRSELVELTGLSQPTITRAISALLDTGLIQQRTDLTRSQGRGRPTVPLEVAEIPWVLAGIAVGTSSTYIGLFDTKGRAIRETDIETHVAELTQEDFIEHIIAGLHRLTTGLDHKLVSIGVSTSGTVDEEGRVYAPNLGWDGMDVISHLHFQFKVPVIVSSAVPAILGSETQAADLSETASTLVLFADDSLGAALSDTTGVHQLHPLPRVSSDVLGVKDELATTALTTAATLRTLAAHGITVDSLDAAVALADKTSADASITRTILDERARLLGVVAAALIDQHLPSTVVVAGSAFYSDSTAPKKFAASARKECVTPTEPVELRMIPTHREIVRAVARAVAIDPLLRTPLSLGKALQTV